jgi:hypothetical protein
VASAGGAGVRLSAGKADTGLERMRKKTLFHFLIKNSPIDSIAIMLLIQEILFAIENTAPENLGAV